ncbi:MAG: alpha/beta fold hydrolase [Coleofasciculus sp. C2-GNP5-27]
MTNPVILVHGIFRTSSVFRKLSPYLKKQGFSVYTLDLNPNNATLGLDQMATQLADFVNQTFAPNQPIDLVGLSMGGLVTRYYVQRLGGIDRVQRYITISAPHHGTWLAYLLNRRACVQMRPGSPLLEDLNRDVWMLERLNFTSIWTRWDFIIIPGSSSRMSVGKDVNVPVFAHACMVINSHSMQAVASALSEPVRSL